jgi:anti-sigma factor RsiW
MKCSKVVDSIEAYLGGTLSPKQRKSFDRHLKECENCSAQLQRCISENWLYRQALAQGRLQGTLRNTVMAQVRREYKPVQAAPAPAYGRRAALWLAPVAAAAQFLIAFWLSGALMFGPAPKVVRSQDSRLVAIKWVHDFKRFNYSAIKGEKGTPGPVYDRKDMQID